MFPKLVKGGNMRRNFSVVVVLIAALYTVACSEAPKTEAVQASNKPPASAGPVSGKTAYWAMYKSAYSWSNDVVPLRLQSKSIPGIKNEAGSAGLWSATFASPRKREAMDFSYAVVPQSPDIVKGVNVGRAIPWSGPTYQVMPFQGSDIVIDSDSAFKTAATQAQSWLKTHPDKEVSFLLGNNSANFAAPVWYVVWGDQKSGYSVFVTAKTGEVTKPIR
jgi:hypothetical protein